jgi:hypothetical protein
MNKDNIIQIFYYVMIIIGICIISISVSQKVSGSVAIVDYYNSTWNPYSTNYMLANYPPQPWQPENCYFGFTLNDTYTIDKLIYQAIRMSGATSKVVGSAIMRIVRANSTFAPNISSYILNSTNSVLNTSFVTWSTTWNNSAINNTWTFGNVTLTNGTYAVGFTGLSNPDTSFTYYMLTNDVNTPDGSSRIWCDGVSTIGVFNTTIRYVGKQTVMWLYGEQTAIPSGAPINYSISNTQTPSDINTTTLEINITSWVNSTGNISNLTNPSVQLWYKQYTALNNNCAIFINRNCTSNNVYKNSTMTKVNNSIYTISLSDTEIFPAYYPWYTDEIFNSDGLNYSVYTSHNVRFMIYNFSTSSNDYNIFVEMNAKNKTGSSNMNIYYCNQSYNSGNPAITNNCELISSYTALTSSLSTSKHNHDKSTHDVVPFKINSVGKTKNSSIVFMGSGTVANAWEFKYILNSSYDNMSFQTGASFPQYNFDASNKIFDIHIHSFEKTDYLSYYTTFNNGTSDVKNSSVTNDFYNVSIYNPNCPYFINPSDNEVFTITSSDTYNTSILINWTRLQANYSTANYVMLYVYDPISTLKYAVKLNLTETGFNLTYITNDSFLAGDYLYSINFYDITDTLLQSCEQHSFNLCQNSYATYLQPCTDGAKLLSYYDENYCGTNYQFPIMNGTYTNCTGIIQNEVSLSQNTWINILLIVMIVATFIMGLFFPVFIMMSGFIMMIYSFLIKFYFGVSNGSTVIFYTLLFVGIAVLFLGLLLTLGKMND